MPTLIVAAQPTRLRAGGTPPLSAMYDQRITDAAERAGWSVLRAARDHVPDDVLDPVVYVTTELAVTAANALNVALLEPPLDLLTRLPEQFVRRTVEATTFGALERLRARAFVKPADPLDKWFDAGVYSDVRDVRTSGPRDLSHAKPVLISEVVEWSVEVRYFVLEGNVIAGSPYLSYGRPAWRWSGAPTPMPTAGRPLVEKLCAAMRHKLPPSFVVDVGAIDDRGWAVVEFNPVWSAGLLNCDSCAVLPALRRATRRRAALSESDRRWDLRGSHSNRPLLPGAGARIIHSTGPPQ